MPKMGPQKPLEGWQPEGECEALHQEAVLAFSKVRTKVGSSPSSSTPQNYILPGYSSGVTPGRELWPADHWQAVEPLSHTGLFEKAGEPPLLSVNHLNQKDIENECTC